MTSTKSKEKNMMMDYDHTNEGLYQLNGSNEHEPIKKCPKLSIGFQTKEVDLAMKTLYSTDCFMENLSLKWNSKNPSEMKDPQCDVNVFTDPFQICLLTDFLENKSVCADIVTEMIEKINWSRKQMDLYEFYQSRDLSNMNQCKLLSNFLHLLRQKIRPWIEKVTNLKLDYVSASCSMYTCGDYLLVHDDLLKDRQIAFIYYLSPWEGNEEWTEDRGGCLEIFNSDERFLPQFPVQRKIPPKNNQFVFFKVGSRSFHQVSEIKCFDYPRLTINGWFHGASNDDLVIDLQDIRPFTKLSFHVPIEFHIDLELLLNVVYLKPSTRKSIQKRIEDNSEICLYEFIQHEIFTNCLKQLLNDDTLKWRRQGPANAQNYEVLEISSAKNILSQLLKLFCNVKMFSLLHDFTQLDLAGINATNPSYSIELQRWTHGNYTVLGDGAICNENTLDLIYYLNASEGAAVVTYLSSEEEQEEDLAMKNNDIEINDSVLLTITPVDNALNIIYRCEGTTKFTKYVSYNTPLDKGPVFAICCSYKE